MDNHDKILARIRKMLALAADAGASGGERENAMRMAHATMAKYNLDMAQVEAAGGMGESRGEERAFFFGRPWARNVCRSIAIMLFCEYIFASSPLAKDKRAVHHFIGRQSNAQTAAELSAYLVASIIKESRKEGRSHNFERREFCLGAAHSIRLRVAELLAASANQKAEKLENQHTPGTALVLANIYEKEQQANQELFEKLHPKTVKALAGKSAVGGEAYGAGRRYGQRVSLNRQLKQGESK